MGDDEPYEILQDGEPTGVVELPVEWIKDDYPYFGMDRVTTIRPHTAPSAVGEIWRREFDGAYVERGLFLLTMHPHIIGHRSRISVLDELIRHMRATAACGSPPTPTSRAASRSRRRRVFATHVRHRALAEQGRQLASDFPVIHGVDTTVSSLTGRIGDAAPA